MTEQGWLQATDPRPILEFLRGKASDRKLRLFTVACCRSIWHLFTDERSRQAVEVAERYADALISKNELEKARVAALSAWKQAKMGGVGLVAWYAAREGMEASARAAAEATVRFATARPSNFSPPGIARKIEDWRARKIEDWRAGLADRLREIIGNPFRPVTLNPSWLTWHDGLLVSMAQRMYDSRDFSDTPVLADALEEAGCQDQDVLRHCRSGSEHVRGCWVIDLLLGKS